MSHYFAAEVKLRTKNLVSRIEQAQQFLDANVFDDQAALELHIKHLTNNITRVHAILQNAAQNNLDEETYVTIQGLRFQAEDILTELNSHVPKQVPFPVPAQSAPTTTTKHLEIKIPTFNGERTKYLAFKQAVNILCDRKQTTPAERLLFLLEHLGEQTAKLVENVPLTDEGHQLAWQILDSEYDDAARIKNDIFVQLTNIPTARDDPVNLKETLDSVEALLRILETYETDANRINDDETYRRLVLSKFPREVIRYISTPGETPTLKQIRTNLRAAIRTEIDVQALVAAAPKLTVKSEPVSAPSKKNTTRSSEVTEPHKPCHFCKESHWADSCNKYLTVEDRKKSLSNTCYLCLRQGHNVGTCTSNKPCYHCGERKKHHSALCPEKHGQQSTPSTNKERSNSSNTVKTQNATGTQNASNPQNGAAKSKEVIHLVNVTEYGTYLTAVANIQNPDTGRILQARILIDPGTARSYINQRVSEMLELKQSKPHVIRAKRFGEDKGIEFDSTFATFNLQHGTTFSTSITASTAPYITDNVPMFPPEQFLENYPQYNYLQFAVIGENWPIDVLIGNDYAFRLLTCKDRIEVNTFQLIHSVFGYLISGYTPGEQNDPEPILFSTSAAMEKLTSLEVIGIKDAYRNSSDEEEAALKQFYEAVSFDGQRYEVPLPWKMEPNFPGTFGLAVGRLRSQLRRLNNNELLEKYDEIFQQQLAAGIIEQAKTQPPSNRVYYIPHQPVIDFAKATTPIRIVFDASARISKNFYSLNEMIYKGKTQLEDITQMLIRFRAHKFAISADIEKAYHTIQLTERDRDYCRFLWLKDIRLPPTEENLQVFRFRRVAFGLTSSQFLLNATITHHINQNPSQFSAELMNDFYVDNLLSGVPDEETAIQFYETTVDIFARCSMNLRCWATNSVKLRQHLPPRKRENNIVVGTLGLKWNTETDRLYLPNVPIDTTTDPTLRTILKQTARIYDPLGWFSVITIQAKILMQAIRKAGCLWDDPLPENLRENWIKITDEFKQVPGHEFTRYIPISSGIEIHAFSDASAKAYGTAVYIKSNEKITLIFAKARVAPAKPLSIPKLELLAATITARAIQFVEAAFRDVPIKRKIMWSDSKCVIAQIKTKKMLPTYVENRVKEIRDVHQLEVRYVPSAENSADLASRGCSFNELPESWWDGPQFLKEPDEKWPSHQIDDHEMEESEKEQKAQRIMNVVVASIEEIPLLTLDVKRYNSLNQLLEVGAILMRFMAKKSTKFANKFPEATERPRTLLMKWYLQQEQRKHYEEVFQKLKAQKFHPLVTSFKLVIDNQGLLRCRGRFEFRPVPETIKYPILLPALKKSWLTKYIIIQAHQNNFHTGTNHTLTAVRKRFWIPAGRAAVYHTIRHCIPCQRYIARPYEQPQDSSLPEFRLTSHQSIWKNIGMDIFGHFFVENSKVWIMLITCLTTRAISLEPLESLSAQHMMLAFRSFIARRALPQLILSDQGTQFQPAIDILQHSYHEDIVWKKIPSKAPWFGAVYERLVGITKNAIERTIHSKPLTSIMFRTILFEVENIVNSRPITYVENDIGIEPLSPNHFLTISPLKEDKDTEKTVVSADRAHLQALWKYVTNVRTQFWDVWNTQYLSLLRERHSSDKTHFRKNTTKIEPRIGKIVLIDERNIKRRDWKLGKIIDLPISSDGKIRAAQIRMSSGHIVSRPIQDLYPLEIEPETEEKKGNEHVVMQELNNTKQDEPEAGHVNGPEDEDCETITLEIDDDF